MSEQYAIDRVREWIDKGLLQVADYASIHPLLGMKVGKDFDWHKCIKDSEKDLEKYNFLIFKCEKALENNHPLGKELALWASKALSGKIKKPKGSVGAPIKKKGAEWFITSLINNVHKKFGIPISRNDESEAHSACDAVSRAIKKVNKELNYQNVIRPQSFHQLKRMYAREKHIVL